MENCIFIVLLIGALINYNVRLDDDDGFLYTWRSFNLYTSFV